MAITRKKNGFFFTIGQPALILLIHSFAQGLTVRRKTEDFPLSDCRTSDIDLLFVADAGTANPETEGFEHYSNQMNFFSQIVDVFIPKSETNLNRARVALLASTVDDTDSNLQPRIETRFDFRRHKTRADLKRSLETDVVPPVSTSFPIAAALYGLQEFYNDSTTGTRSDAQQILIIVVNGSKQQHLRPGDDLKAFNSTAIKMLMVLVGADSGFIIMNIFPSNNVVEVTSFQDLMQNQMIPIILCLRCHDNWFKFKPDGDHSAIANVSCYRVFYSDFAINWVKAGEKCQGAESQLASIETLEEFSYLRQVMPSKLHYVMNLTRDSNASIDVYIGLKRDSSSYGQRFRWVNDLPLVYTSWHGGEPVGGHIQGCAFWTFNVSSGGEFGINESISAALGDLRNRSEYQTDSDAWFSIGCGYKNARYYLCESKKLPSFRQGQMPRAARTKDQSVRAAVARGQLGLKTEYTAIYGLTTSLVATSTMIQTHDKKGEFSVIVDHRYENRMSSNHLVMFACRDVGKTFVTYSVVCDHIPHCPNRRDEEICSYRKCDSLREFTCKSGQCIPLNARCDLYEDCVDKSDEAKCIKCQNGLCHDGRCLPKHWFADGEVDCNACSSRGSVQIEMNSVTDENISQCVFTCNRTQCVYTSMLGDGVLDCTGPEGPLDETLGQLEATSCYSKGKNIYNNWAPRCIYVKDRYDGLLGCRSLIHLQKCEYFICPEGYIKCPRSYCIPLHYVTNGVYDCPSGEDETTPLDCAGNFKCFESTVCLHPNNVCDKQKHCPNGDDENGCDATCKTGFRCLAGTVTVADYDLSLPLTDLTFIDPRTRYLDLSGVNMSLVFPEFPPGIFYNLLQLKLSHCGITHVDTVAYSQNDLWSVIDINLSYNNIKSIAVSSIFRHMVSLRTLNLSHNYALTRLHPDSFNTFSSMSPLLDLDLSHTNISFIHNSLLVTLQNLERLNLTYTQIHDLGPDMFPVDFTLQTLDLRGLQVNSFYQETFKYVTFTSNFYTDTFKLCCPQLHNPNTPMYVCHAPSDPFSSCSDLMGQTMPQVVLWVMGAMAIIGNIVVAIYRLSCDRSILKMAYGHFIMHLSFSDLLMGIYLLIIAIADSHYRGTYVWDEKEWRGSFACKVAGFLSTLSSETSTLFIFLITVDRFLVIKFPFGQLRMNPTIIMTCCILAWIIGLGIAMVPFLPPFQHWTIYNSNGMCLGLPLVNKQIPGWEFSTAVFVVVNFFLFILIAIGQIIIYKTMADMRMTQGSLTNANNRRAQDFAVARHLSVIAVTDFMCWFPIGVMGILALCGYELGIDAYSWSAVLILPVNSAINPLIYTIPALTQKWFEFRMKSHREDSSRCGTRTNE